MGYVMTLAAKYRAKASECARVAFEEQDRAECDRLLRMGVNWISLAENEEWQVRNSLVGLSSELVIGNS